MRRSELFSILLPLLALGPPLAFAEVRPRYEDAIVVERSELIVVGHLKEGTIEYVPHEKKPQEGRGWEHHATLVVTEVLKGRCGDKTLPIIIHYGLAPVVGGFVERDGFGINRRALRKDYPEDIIEIFDTGNSCIGGPSLVKDAREDNLWFLRRRSGLYGREPGTGKYGVVDPEDLRPLQWKDYFLMYLADNPEAAIEEYAKRNPDAEGARRYLDHLAVQRILKIENAEERYDRLRPFFLNRTTWNMKSEARDGLVACGKTAGGKLKEVFDDPKHHDFRQEIILMWRDMEYREITPVLIDLLKRHDQFWSQQHLEKGWWNQDVESAQTCRRRDVYGEVYYVVCALRAFKDARAREVIEMTRKRWKALDFDNPQITEECDAALRELADGRGRPSQEHPKE